MAVNVSPSQLTDPDFVTLVADILRETGLRPGQLSMEVGEPSMSTDRRALVAVLNALREVGVRLAVDGFGAGSSSLAVLRRLSLDWVKIAETLVRSVAVEPTDAVLMRLVIKFAHCVGLRVCRTGRRPARPTRTARRDGLRCRAGTLARWTRRGRAARHADPVCATAGCANAGRHRRTYAKHLVAVVRGLGRS
jgi:EAL domain-containing protein (putative c-di-GMP-specific phosphodiesterase class I)